ncbi:Bifunctional transcriptional activator/DNA repair enzyme AdaA [Falsiruegeria litorea R37]|uniref:Bifunctional transcriptional activator/DNA repair enzyme AdaA n=2 Tax=Falsiruegeria litorea TaxID=1280831 RepID=A0A1Y5T951_9RHOB|nr:Bifunctional transcriptional activator/DNA repair enzyme AdaA [Falsiruegeria litorea R37]
MAANHDRSDIPMVRATVLAPVVQALKSRGEDIDVFLAAFDLSVVSITDPTSYIRNDIVYRVYAAAAELRNDQRFCTSVGRNINLADFLPFGAALEEATTIGGFISRFTQAVASETNSISQSLFVEDTTAYFSAKRKFVPTVSPAHIDGFMIGIWITFLHEALDFRWDPASVLVRMCDPAVLPQEFHGIRAIKSNDRGFSIRFPAAWLTIPLNGVLAPEDTDDLVGPQLDMLAPKGFVEAIRAILEKHISESNLSVETAAELCGFSKSALARRLAKFDTTIVEILTGLKMEAAKGALANSNASIQSIALSLGYSDATAFSRAFRKRTGLSPRAYRQSAS